MSVTNVTIPTAQSFILVDTRTGPNKVLFLPTASTIQGRYLSIKDYYGNATASTVTISTSGLDRIDQSGIRYTLASSFGSIALLSDGLRSWNMLGLYEGGDTAISMVAVAVAGGAVTATGGTVTTSGSYKIHTFTTTGANTFTLTSPASITAQVLVVGGGGSGGSAYVGGGGGAGGAVFNGSFTITAGTYTVTVGTGAPRSTTGVGYAGTQGANSSFSSITGTGGGGGGTYLNVAATNGGCGGGGGYNSGQFGTGSQGGNGAPYGTDGNGGFNCGGGGGGMGGTAPTPSGVRPSGGAGATYTVAGTAYTLAGGGGAGSDSLGGLGQAGGGLGGNGNQNGQTNSSGTDATANTGSGGGGGGGNNGALYGGAGGSGIVIIAYLNTFSLISTGLTNRWLFNAGSGTSIADTVGTLTMYLSGGYTWTSATPNSAITSGSIQFDGSSGKALSTAANSAPFATSNWSISMWIYVTATPSSPYIYWALDSNAITFFLDNGNWASLGGPAGCIHVFGCIGETRTNSICPTSAWTHVVTVVNNLSMTFYFNGVADTLFVNKTITASSASLNSWFGIGPNNFPSNVKMTDVRYYNVALSQTQINQIYAGTG
jgi:hypothetical protein